MMVKAPDLRSHGGTAQDAVPQSDQSIILSWRIGFTLETFLTSAFPRYIYLVLRVLLVGSGDHYNEYLKDTKW